jgi:hypothetical protein
MEGHPSPDRSDNPELGAIVASWRSVYPDSVESDVDLEDWVENAIKLHVALEAARRAPNDIEVFIDVEGDYSADHIRAVPRAGETPAATAARRFDLDKPFVFIGAELRRGDFVSANPHVVAPSMADTIGADRYFWNPGFHTNAGRVLQFATYDDMEGDLSIPPAENLINVLKARRDAGQTEAFVKIAATKRGFARIPLAGLTDKQLSQALLERFDWTLIEVAGRKDALLVQDCVTMTHEYRIFVVDGQAVAGAGCIEEFCPLLNRGDAFDPRTREIRISEQGPSEVAERPDIVSRYLDAAPRIIDGLVRGNPDMRTFVVDLCLINDQVAVVEVNPSRNSGLYALSWAPVFDAQLAAARAALDLRHGSDSAPVKPVIRRRTQP